MFNHMKMERMPIHPGEVLKYEFLEELNITQSKLAEDIHVPFPAINQIVNGKRGISVDMAFKLAKYFDTSVELWMNLQKNYEVENFWFNKNKLKALENINKYTDREAVV